MASVLRGAGLTVVETPGWANRGYAGQDLQDIRGVVWHHTATGSARSNNLDGPTVNLCINGRSDLPGPLCQIVLGRFGTVFLIAAGVGNHAGVGIAEGIPRDAGNHYMIGIEMESSGVAPWDWTADQLRVAPHLGAALERAYLLHRPEHLRLQIAHYEYSTEGKIDPAGWPGGMDGLRASINKLLGSPVGIAAPPKPAPAPAAPAGSSYEQLAWTVDPGDTLAAIAKHYGADVADLVRFNGLPNGGRSIQPGQTILIPGPTTWTVERGDTVAKVAAYFGVDVARIAKLSGLKNPGSIKVGQVLTIQK